MAKAKAKPESKTKVEEPSAPSSSEEAGAKAPSLPVVSEPTFSEAEVQAVADFINMAYRQADWKGSMADYQKRMGRFNEMHKHVSKLESYIMELRKVTNKPKAK